MNYSLQYIRIEFKRAVHAFVSGMVTLIIISVITAGSAAALYALLQSLGISDPVRIALCTSEESMPPVMIRFIQNLDSVKAVCKLEETDEESARQGVKDGTYGAAVILPANFYEDVNTGVNTPARILIPSNAGSEVRSFGELMESVVSMVDTVEGGIYAVTDGYIEYGMMVSRGDMENYLTGLSYDLLMARTTFFKESFEDAFDVKGLVSYMTVCSCLLINMVLCTGFGYMYSKRTRTVNGLLVRNGLSGTKTGMIRFLIMFFQLILITVICAGIIKVISAKLYLADNEIFVLASEDLAESSKLLLNPVYVLPVLFCICAFTHLIFSMFRGREDSGLILLIVFMIMLIVSGCIVPSVFLPEKAAAIGKYLPAAMWRKDVFFGNAVRELIIGLAFLIGGEVLTWLYTRSDFS